MINSPVFYWAFFHLGKVNGGYILRQGFNVLGHTIYPLFNADQFLVNAGYAFFHPIGAAVDTVNFLVHQFLILYNGVDSWFYYKLDP